MDISVALLCFFLFTKAALTLGSDQDYQIDIINELDMANATYGITQVAGLHNSSKAFLFREPRGATPSGDTVIAETLRKKTLGSLLHNYSSFHLSAAADAAAPPGRS
ncbi:hypothetical protein LDENG_00266430 [Lucifuga dentata]|nr:hypothetical protein LDENG_00266430 [Lucifuga dentata]